MYNELPAEGFTDSIIADLIDQTGFVVEANILTELTITDLHTLKGLDYTYNKMSKKYMHEKEY